MIPWQRLAEFRFEAGRISQSALDGKIGRARGTTLQIERGKLLPPDRKTCDKIDEALGRPVGSLWEETAIERLRRLDPDLFEWHREIVTSLAGIDLVSIEADNRSLRAENADLRARLDAVRKAAG